MYIMYTYYRDKRSPATNQIDSYHQNPPGRSLLADDYLQGSECVITAHIVFPILVTN